MVRRSVWGQRRSFSSVALLATAVLAACGDEPPGSDSPDAGLDGPVADAPIATDASEVDAPELDAPELDAALPDAPELDAPELDAPELDAALPDAPELDAALPDAPEVDAPEVDAALPDAPSIDAPPDALVCAPGTYGPTCEETMCGDGVAAGVESCDLGVGNADRPALAVRQGTQTWPIRPVTRSGTAAAFYSFSSDSAHTGYEVVGTSRLLFHRNSSSGVLSLVVVQGIDTPPGNQPTGAVNMTITDLPAAVTVVLSDDPGECVKTAAGPVQASWSFSGNTDGCVLGGFPFPGDFRVTVSASFLQGITAWEVVAAEGSPVLSLDLAAPIELIAFPTASACRTDCTVPACDDGILDGGEVCDDGGGGGCPGTCP